MKIKRDSRDVTALSLISKEVADDVQQLAAELNLSVIEVLVQAVGLLKGHAQDHQRSAIRKFWASLTPEERSERASRASRARWDAKKD